MPGNGESVDWRKLREFAGVDLAHSFVLSWHFEAGTPSVYQYLLAHGIAQYVNERRITHRANRIMAIKRGIEKGELKGDPESGQCSSSRERIDEYLKHETVNWYFKPVERN